MVDNARIVILGVVAAVAALLGEAGLQPVYCQAAAVDSSAVSADSLIAAARRDLGLSSADTTADFTDADELTRQIRILTKQLAATGEFSKPDLSDIKMAGLDAEEALRRNDGRSQRRGRVIMEEWVATLETIAPSR